MFLLETIDGFVKVWENQKLAGPPFIIPPETPLDIPPEAPPAIPPLKSGGLELYAVWAPPFLASSKTGSFAPSCLY